MTRANAPLHYFLSWLQKARTGAIVPPLSRRKDDSVFPLVPSETPSPPHGLNEPVAPKKQIVVDQPNKEPEKREAISRRPFFGWTAQFLRTSPQFILEKLSQAGSHFVGQTKLFRAGVTVVIGLDSSAG